MATKMVVAAAAKMGGKMAKAWDKAPAATFNGAAATLTTPLTLTFITIVIPITITGITRSFTNTTPLFLCLLSKPAFGLATCSPPLHHYYPWEAVIVPTP